MEATHRPSPEGSEPQERPRQDLISGGGCGASPPGALRWALQQSPLLPSTAGSGDPRCPESPLPWRRRRPPTNQL